MREAMNHAAENAITGTEKLHFKFNRDSDGIFCHTAKAVTIAVYAFYAAICRNGWVGG